MKKMLLWGLMMGASPLLACMEERIEGCEAWNQFMDRRDDVCSANIVDIPEERCVLTASKYSDGKVRNIQTFKGKKISFVLDEENKKASSWQGTVNIHTIDVDLLDLRYAPFFRSHLSGSAIYSWEVWQGRIDDILTEETFLHHVVLKNMVPGGKMKVKKALAREQYNARRMMADNSSFSFISSMKKPLSLQKSWVFSRKPNSQSEIEIAKDVDFRKSIFYANADFCRNLHFPKIF